MPTLFAVTATRTLKLSDGWTATRELPIFYLDAEVQGITDVEHARLIVGDILIDDEHTTHSVHIEEASP